MFRATAPPAAGASRSEALADERAENGQIGQAARSWSSDHPFSAEGRNFLRRIAKLGEDRIRMLAEKRRALADRAGRPRKTERRFHDGRGAGESRKLDRFQIVHRLDMRIVQRLLW